MRYAGLVVIPQLFLVLFLFSPAVPRAESISPALDFEYFSSKVLSSYPALKSANARIDIALARQMQAKAGFWPSLNVSAGYQITDDPVGVFGILLRQEKFTSSDFDLKRINMPSRHQDFSSGVHAQWPLFDAMQTINRVRALRGTVEAAGAEASFTRMEAFLVAQDAYLNAMTINRLASVIAAVMKDTAADLQKAKDLKDKGMILGADYYSARVMLGDLVRIKNDLERQKKAMMILLNILMGEPVNKEWTLAPMVKEGDFLPLDIISLTGNALARRQDLLALEARLKSANADLAGAKASGLPVLNLFADALNNRNKITASGGDNYAVGLKAQMPLFDPARKGRIKEAQGQQMQLQQDIQTLKDSVLRDIAQETARYEALRDNIAVFRTMSQDAQEAVTLIAPLYNEGRKSVADLTAARRVYLQAVEAYEKALTGLWLSQARLLFLSGELDSEAMHSMVERGGV